MHTRGFTLVELVVGLAIGAILLGIAVPGYAFLVNSGRLAAATNDLVSSLQLARSEAVKRQHRVSVCKADAASAPHTCDASADWQDGWLIFVDGGLRGVIDGTDTILRVQQSLSRAIQVTAEPNFSEFVSYRPDGVSQGGNGLGTGTLRICVDHTRRDVIINNTGRPRLHSDVC